MIFQKAQTASRYFNRYYMIIIPNATDFFNYIFVFFYEIFTKNAPNLLVIMIKRAMVVIMNRSARDTYSVYALDEVFLQDHIHYKYRDDEQQAARHNDRYGFGIVGTERNTQGSKLTS